MQADIAKPQAALRRKRLNGFQLFDQSVGGFRRQIYPVLVVDQHARRALAGADALRKLDGDLAVRRRLAGLDAQLLANVGEQLIAAPQGTRQAPADPEARPANRALLVAEEA